jgi:tetratricopeptide (TPR) repeat protein
MKLKILLLFILASYSLMSQPDDIIEAVKKDYSEYKSKTIIDSTDKRLIVLLENLFLESLQSNENTFSESTLASLRNFNEDSNLPNWHLFYLYMFYQSFVAEATQNPNLANPELQLWLIETLTEEVENIFGIVPVIVAIYKGEALLATGQKSKAINHFDKFIKIYPDAIPIKVYQFQLESNFDKKESLYNDLKTNYPDHWMVKSL